MKLNADLIFSVEKKPWRLANNPLCLAAAAFERYYLFKIH
jgi:hypothetical protein